MIWLIPPGFCEKLSRNRVNADIESRKSFKPWRLLRNRQEINYQNIDALRHASIVVADY